MATILIIEDEDDIRLLLRLSLRGEGYEILEAATGADAAVHWSDADLVLLDIRLPDVDGLDLLRSLPATAAPVIAMSAHAGDEMRTAALQAGCVEYVRKPFVSAQFAETIRAHLIASGRAVPPRPS
jgi:two-component system, OmpR family, KDP operon response regulator KdpE